MKLDVSYDYSITEVVKDGENESRRSSYVSKRIRNLETIAIAKEKAREAIDSIPENATDFNMYIEKSHDEQMDDALGLNNY